MIGAAPLAVLAAAIILTGPEGGPYDRIGRAIAAEANRAFPAEAALELRTSAGSLASLAALGAEGAPPALAIVQADLLRDALLGDGRFDRAQADLRTLAVLHREVVHAVVRPGAGIARVEDLRGRRIGVGARGAGGHATARRVLALFELGAADFTPVTLDDEAAVTALLTGEIDSFITVAGIPHAPVARALASGATLIAVDPPQGPIEHGEPRPIYPLERGSVPAGAYAGVAEALPTLEVAAVLVANESFPRVVAEDVLEAMFSGIERVRAAHPAARAIDRARAAMPAPTPLHPAAVRYYEREGPLDGPIELRIDTWVWAISNVDEQEGTYDFDGYVDVRWRDPRLAAGDALPFDIQNAVEFSISGTDTRPVGEWLVLSCRLRAKLRARLDLRRHPFDRQVLPIEFEHQEWPTSKVILKPREHPSLDLRRDRLGPDFHLDDWNVTGVSTRISETPYALDDVYSRYTFEIAVERRLLPFVLKDIAPIALMVFLACLGCLIPGDHLDAKLVLTVLSLLVAVELHLAHAERMPEIGYLTLGDWMYVISYFSISISIIEAIGDSMLVKSGRGHIAKKIRRWGLVLVLATFVAPLIVLYRVT